MLALVFRERSLGFRGSRKCSRDTYPESYITEYTQCAKIKHRKLCPQVLLDENLDMHDGGHNWSDANPPRHPDIPAHIRQFWPWLSGKNP